MVEGRQLHSGKGFRLTVTADGVIIYLRLVSAELEGQLLSVDEVLEALHSVGVVYGIQEDTLDDLVKHAQENTLLEVAVGKKAERGSDATIEYSFETTLKKQPKVDATGNIDYKDLNYIQSARAEQLLARKTPTTDGVLGTSVFGKEIPAQKGRDSRLTRGANTELSDDGLELRATIDGSIVFKAGNISVQPEQDIHGSVDASTGNIKNLGSLKVQKDILSDFSVDVGGALEVGGSIEDATVTASGSVVARGGFFGSGKGSITAGGAVTLKYVENQVIRAEGPVQIAGDVINADIYSDEEVVLQGKAGKILGGKVIAKHLVRTGSIGNEAGVPTHVQVGLDLSLAKRIKEIADEMARLTEDQKRVKEALVQLYQLEMANQLSDDKKAALEKLKTFNSGLPQQVKELETEQTELKEQLAELVDARIVVEDTVHAGSVIHFGPVYKEILETIKHGSVFEQCDGNITRSEFNPEKEKRREMEQEKRAQEKQRQEQPQPVAAKT